MKYANSSEIIATLVAYHTLIKIKAELDQFVEGLQPLNIHNYIIDYPQIMEPLFVYENKQLTAGIVACLTLFFF